jgi:hypothetical protein
MSQRELTFVKRDRQCGKVDEESNKVDRQCRNVS